VRQKLGRLDPLDGINGLQIMLPGLSAGDHFLSVNQPG
jgi:hypothetical protein